MTETNPVASMSSLKPHHEHLPVERQLDLLETVGMLAPGLEAKIVDDDGSELPWDGVAFGELLIRGPWIAAEYYRDARSPASFTDGWLRTGDVCTIDPEGYIRITDRAKDVIKSGGEWISSWGVCLLWVTYRCLNIIYIVSCHCFAATGLLKGVGILKE